MKAVAGIFAPLSPVTAQLPATMHLRNVVALLIIVAACFVAGLVVRTGPGLRAKTILDRYMLERIPGYTLLRGLAGPSHRSRGGLAGTVYILERARVHLVDVPFTEAVSVISKWGAGSGELVAAMRRQDI